MCRHRQHTVIFIPLKLQRQPVTHMDGVRVCTVLLCHRCEDIVQGEPAELLVLSQEDTFFNFKVREPDRFTQLSLVACSSWLLGCVQAAIDGAGHTWFTCKGWCHSLA